MNDDLLTAKEISTRYKVSYITVFRWIKAGKLPAFKVGKQYRVKQEDLDAFIEESKPERKKL